jgi:tetratricopeptide (TPR) repeat protein
MGAIYRATDTALGREVAIKVLQDKHGPDSGLARRFTDEARITAQLQHPAIPPVHDLGTLPDGRPFLAMKLIKGRTLEELLAARPDVTSERGRFLGAYEQVCQAVAYAHAHGVIHRDLKPANVMVGAFGEVQVMDWGLAKVLGARASQPADPEATTTGTQVVSSRDSDGAFTQAGSVLGTPAFMPPEQAAGAVGKVNQRSDVFGLGALLAVILTGRPPFGAASAETTRVKAAQGDVSDCFARLDECGAEPELVALCKRCLNPKASERPSDGGEVARAVACLRQAAEERARSAELDRVRAEGERIAAELRGAEERKRRRVQWALALALGLLLVSGLAAGWWQAEQGRVTRERQARNAEAVVKLLDQCEQALQASDSAAAAVTLEAAQKRAVEGGAENEAGRLACCQNDLDLLRELDAVDQFRWTPAGSKLPKNEAVAARYREALRRFGADPDGVGAEAASARVSGSAMRVRLVAALDRLLRAQKSAAVRAALRTIDPAPFRDAVRDAVRSSNRAALAELARQAQALAQPPWFAAFLGEDGMIDVPKLRRALLRAALERWPGDLGLLMGLGLSYPLDAPQVAEERARWFQAAVAVAPANPATYLGLGSALRDKGDLDGASAAYRGAIRLHPQYAYAHNNLGIVLVGKGDLDGAIAAFQEARRLDPKNAQVHNLPLAQRMRDLLPRLADVLAGKDRPKNATEACEFAELCFQPFQKRYVDGIRLFQEAFAAEPNLAENLETLRRYDAVCYALLAGCDTAPDAAKVDGKERARLRRQALAWLRADLVLLRRQASSGEAVPRQDAVAKLSMWLRDGKLEGVRPGPNQTEMPPEERATWDALWADVKATLALAQKPPSDARGK